MKGALLAGVPLFFGGIGCVFTGLITSRVAVWLDSTARARRLMAFIGLVGAAEISFTQARQLNPRCEDADHALHRISQVGLVARWRGKLRELLRR